MPVLAISSAQGPGSWHCCVGCCDPRVRLEGLLQMFGACCHDSQLQSLAGHERWEGGRWGACARLLRAGSGA